MHALIVLVLLAVVLVVPVDAQVKVDIGIQFPAPPRLVVVPEVRVVQYVPTASANVFFYDGQYWAFVKGGWYASRAHKGPWVVVSPQVVPHPVLLVPVRYYHVPPGHWKQWGHQEPPRWHDEWGREWADKRGWKGRGHDRDDNDHGKGRGRGHGKKG